MKKRILIVNDLISGGGVENVLFSLVCYLCDRSYNVTVMTLSGTKDEFYSIFPEQVDFQNKSNDFTNKIKKYSLKWIVQKCINKLCKICDFTMFNKKYDVAIAMKEGECSLLVSKIKAYKRYVWIHVDYDSFHWTKYLFKNNENEKLLFQTSFDKVVCVSQAVKNSVVNQLGVMDNLCVRYNPINYVNVINKSKEVCSLTRDKSRLLFVTIGRLDAIKQYDMLIAVCKELLNFYDFELWIIGEGNERNNLESLITVSDKVRIKLLGNQANPYTYLKQADCFICSSKSESYCIAIQEALILEVPVVSVKFPAIYEATNEKYGIIVNNNAQSLKEGIEHILNNPRTLDTYKINIRKYYKPQELWFDRLKHIEMLWDE